MNKLSSSTNTLYIYTYIYVYVFNRSRKLNAAGLFVSSELIEMPSSVLLLLFVLPAIALTEKFRSSSSKDFSSSVCS